MPQVRAQWTEALQRDMYRYMFEQYDMLDRVFDKIFDVQPLVGSYEKETTSIGMGQLSERFEGADIIASSPLEGFTAVGKSRTWSDGFEVTMEMQEDTSPEKIANFARQVATTWAEGVVWTQETFTARFFNEGGFTAGSEVFDNEITGVVEDTSGDFIYDGKPFFNLQGNERSSKGGGQYYNGLSLPLNATNLQTAYNLMTDTNNRNERDERIALKPTIILYPSNLKFTVMNLLNATHVTGSDFNDINTVQNLVEPVEWQYLTDTDAWFLGVPRKGIKVLARRQPVIDFYTDPKSKKLFVTIDARWGAYVTNWRYWVGSNFSTS